MIILDTNVISELMRSQASDPVASWARRQDIATMYLTVITQAELLYGVALLPEGRRKQRLRKTIERMLHEDFAERLLAFDALAAPHYAAMATRRRLAGRPLAPLDGQIAAITKACNAQLATRITADFDLCGIEVLNPFLVHG